MPSGSGPLEPHVLGKLLLRVLYRPMATQSTTDSAALGLQTERMEARTDRSNRSSPQVRRRRLIV